MGDADYKRFGHIGPYGMSCPCCTDHAHKRINKHTFYNRKIRKKLKKELHNLTKLPID